MEQVLYLLTENDGKIDFKKNNTFESIVKTRLELLKTENPNAYHVLLASSILGIKFYPFSLAQIFSLEDNEINKIMDLLKERYYVEQVNEFSFEFKNSTLWNTILKEARTDEDFAQINQKIYEFLYDYTFSSKAVLAIVASDLNQKLSAFEIWTENVKLAAYIGDINFYVISQKQCLKLLDELIGVDSVLIKTNIYERLSKILSDLKPNQAMEYLPTVIDNAQKNGNLFKEIDLLGYLAKVCAILEKPYGIIECVDEVDKKIGEGFELEKALIKAKKLDALFLIGNVGELITIAENEVLPPIEKSLNSGAKSPIIFEIWIKTLYTLANAFTLQGNNQGIQVIARIFEIFEKNKIENESFTNKLKLTLALAYSIKGDFLSSDTILEEFIKNVDDKKLDNECVLRWNLTNIYNRFLKRDYKNLQEDLFQLVTFANNVNDHFSKNILKTLLGKLLKEDYAPDKARDIFEEQVTYFAKEKNATGALLSWYWIAEITLETKGPKKALEIAQKALDVAQNPKINNYYFIALFNKLMAECYLVLFDYEAVKIHLEKAVLIAKKFQLLELLTRLYLIYSKYLQDLAAETSDTQMDYLTSVLKMNKKALAIAETLKSPVLVSDVAKSEATLNSFCKLNNIKLIDTDV